MDTCPTCGAQEPGDGLFCSSCDTHIPGRSFATSYTPPWGVFERSMQSENPEVQRQATDLFLEARERETAVSSKARHWEQGRKTEWGKNKKAWKKQQTNA